MPPSSRFVVKNGSKIRSITSGVDAGAGVADAKDGRRALVRELDRDLARLTHRLLGVGDEVQEDLLDLAGAREDGDRLVRVALDEDDLLVQRGAAEQLDRLLDDAAQIDRLELVGALAGEVEQRADDVLDLEPGLLDQPEPVVRLRAGLDLLEQELDQAEDREQRVVDLVRDAGREFADRGELAALHHLLLEAAALGEVGDER